MVYITLEELKDTLPAIMNDWIDVGDESWEWIFNAIEQNCHVGKKKKDKKKWKTNTESMVDTYNVLTKRVDELSNKVSKLNDICNAHTVRLDNIGRDITAAKSMAETAKQRTEVDYSKYSGKSDGNISYSNPEDKNCRLCKYGDGEGNCCSHLPTCELEKKDVESCTTCKHYCGDGVIKEPCIGCEDYNCWEAKDE